MLAGAHAAAAPGAAHATPASADPAISETLTTSVLRAVTMRSGTRATIAYRADDTAGGIVTVDLLVTTRTGHVVRTLAREVSVVAGVDQTWRGRIRLRPGLYRIVAHARDLTGRSEISAESTGLRMRPPLPPLVPTARARRAAFTWAARRAGQVAVAVVDSRGHLYGYRAWRPYLSASVVKAMLLVAYLRTHKSVSAAMRFALTRMIVSSDNDAADAVYRSVGPRGLTHLARTAHMHGFHASSSWIVCRITAADMARFFRDMERYLPPRHRRFANQLLSHISAYQRWGIPVAAEPRGYRVYFKPGWLGAWVLASEAGRLERGRVCLGLAVLTDDNPTSTYGRDTIAGVTARLLQR